VEVNPLMRLAESERHINCCQNDVCAACGSPVSTYNANSDVIDQRPEASEWDWWCACDNANCVHAYGEGLFQDALDWVKNDAQHKAG
jgi:hypothetical protein